jgi:3-hydroxyacyl-CoA dehydrogenase/3-hydroxy-2-methylbutyryl-CoA dehydrogenase
MKGLVAIVTGAGSGLGRATAERFISQGAKVTLCDLPTSDGNNVAKALGPNATFVPVNVTSEADVKAALDETKLKFGKLNILVNCAGEVF